MAEQQHAVPATERAITPNGSMPDLPAKFQDREIPLTDNARKVLHRRYIRTDIHGNEVETEQEMFWRVAWHVAEAEELLNGDRQQWAERFFDMLTKLEFLPNSPTFTGAGTPLGQLAACFVLPIEDDMGKVDGGIFDTLRNAALIQQTGGGNGFAFSRLRPKGAPVHSSSGIATGPVGFLNVYDKAFGEIAQGGTRRGANMAVLRVDHPDIREFIKCKAQEGDIENFNISVGATDTFMRAVANDEEYELVNPQDGEIWDTVNARELFDEVVKYAHRNGEPGMLFLDAANRENPVPHLYELEATNPCVTGDTLIYTADGMRRARELAADRAPESVVVDSRFGVEALQPASRVFATGTKDVYRVATREGYELRLTENHKVMTPNGWVEAGSLQPDDEVFILDRRGEFGTDGSEELGLVLGWLVGDGTVNQVRAVLSFFGEEKAEIAPTIAEAVTALVDTDRTYGAHPTRNYPVGLTEIEDRDEVRIQSDRLRLLAVEYGLDEEKLQVPDVIFKGTEATQRAFLRALFTADGTVLDGGEKGCSIRLTSVSYELLQDVQRVLLNFGIASRIYRERRSGGIRQLPDGQGGYTEYYCQAYHELAISKDNLVRFARQVGFLSGAKQSALLDYLNRMTRGPYRERFTARVVSVEHDGKEMVYDLNQPTTNSFVANGFVVHNCGEQWLGPYENCCLGSINLARHIVWEDETARIDWDKLAETARTATRFLDDVVTSNKYVPAVPELREAAERARRIGLGIMGLADVLYAMRVRYGSHEGQELAAQLMEWVRYHSMLESIELSEERGPFKAIEGSIYDPDNVTWQPPTPLEPYQHDWRRPDVTWNTVLTGIKKHGIRNAAQTTVAPTGTLSTVSGVEGYGCEPVFALAYVRHVHEGDETLDLMYTSPLFDQALAQAGFSEDERHDIAETVSQHGTCQDVEAVPADFRDVFVVSSDITPKEHVRMQAALQAFVDNSLSKTINFPETASVGDVAEAYQLAWELGCKGITVYVTGSREKVVLETKKTMEEKQGEAGETGQAEQVPAYVAANGDPKPRKRPRHLDGSTYFTRTPLGKAYVTVNRDTDGEPFEVFANVGKAGSDIAAVSEAIGRLISYILRVPSPISPTERLKLVQEQLTGIGGGRHLGFGANRILSLPDALAQVLKEDLVAHSEDTEFINPGGQVNGKIEQQELFQGMLKADLCPECGHASLVNEEGCRKCYSCGFSEC